MKLPLIYTPPGGGTYQPRSALTGATWEEVEPFYEANDPIRRIERASIRQFMVQNRQFLTGRVLDFGAGKPGTCYQPEPYRDLVEGEYVAHDKSDGDLWDRGLDPFDAVMLNQVIQYLKNPALFLGAMACNRTLKPGGCLVMTWPVCWPEVEPEDKLRHTKTGMCDMLETAGFTIVSCELRAEVRIGGLSFPLGYGVVAQK